MSERVRSKTTSKKSKGTDEKELVRKSKKADPVDQVIPKKPKATSVLAIIEDAKKHTKSRRESKVESPEPVTAKRDEVSPVKGLRGTRQRDEISSVKKVTKDTSFKTATEEDLAPKELDILERCRRFFSADLKYISEMLSIINGESSISIRVIDWFVSNYSKKQNTIYRIKINGTEKLFNVNSDYKNQLGGYSKLYFDPFCRKKKVVYRYRSETLSKPIIFATSVGQLNFFQWAIRNKVIFYVQKHLDEIDQDMKVTTRLNREKKLTESIESDESEEEADHEPDQTLCSTDTLNKIVIGSDKKPKKKRAKTRRHQLSQSPYDKGIRVTTTPIVIDFD